MYDFLFQGAWTIGVKVGHFQWFWLGTTKKALFWPIFSILAMKGPQTWQKSLITWKYDGKTPQEKNWGSFVHWGLRYEFLRKKIWTVPLILQFNISTIQMLFWNNHFFADCSSAYPRKFPSIEGSSLFGLLLFSRASNLYCEPVELDEASKPPLPHSPTSNSPPFCQQFSNGV